jgi:hypothetical protein
MPKPEPISESKQLVVEGRSTQRFFVAILSHLGLSGIQVQNFGGKDELRGFLKALRNSSGFFDRVRSLGVVRDGEENVDSTFQSVQDALKAAGFAVPNQPENAAGNTLKVNVLMLPNAMENGMLETICLEAVSDDPVIQCINTYFECVNQTVKSLPRPMEKARVQAYLASRPTPGLLLGEAADKGYWPWESPAFDHVKNFLKAL